MLDNGKSLEDCEEAWIGAETLKAKLALALRGDHRQYHNIAQELIQRFGPGSEILVNKCNQMAHTGAGDDVDLESFIRDTRSLSEQLKAVT